MFVSLRTFFAERRLVWPLGVLIALLTALLYAPTVGYELVDLDDLMYVNQNRIVLDGLTWPAVRMAFSEVWHGMWAPGLWLSYMLDVDLFGLNAWGFHLVNLVLHVANAALAYLLFWSWTRKPWRAFWAAAFWAWHPLRIESVAWVAERKDVLSGLFFLLCIGAYGLARREPAPPAGNRRTLTVVSTLMLAAGLLVKPMLMTTPCVLLLMDVWPLKRLRLDEWRTVRILPRLILEKWAFWILAAAAAFLAMGAHAQAGAILELPWLARLKMVPLHYAFYLLRTVRPIHLTVLYEPMFFSRTDFLVAVVALGAPTWWFWLERRRHPNALVGWIWFLGLLVPVSGLVRFGAQSVADRFTYLPALGLSMALLAAFAGLRSGWTRGLRALICAAILLGLAQATRRQLPVWQNSTALYDHLLRIFPTSPFGLHYRAMQQIRSGDPMAAEAAIDDVILRNPHVELYRYPKAMAMGAQGRAAEAEEWLLARPPGAQTSIRGYWEWHLGLLAFQLGRYEEAELRAADALRKMPVNDTSRNDVALLGMAACFEKGDPVGALEWARLWGPYRNRARVDLPDLLPFHLTQWIAGNRRTALEYFRRLLQTRPDDVEGLNNVAWILATADWGGPEDPWETVGYVRRALEIGGPHPVLLDTLAAALAQAGDFAAAQASAEQALALARPPGRAPLEFDLNIEKRLRYYRQKKPWREDQAAGRLLRAYYER